MDTLDRDRHHRATAALPGRHACAVVDRPGERRHWLTRWTREGLASGERVVTIESPSRSGTYARMLDAEGLDWRNAASTGQLLVLEPQDVSLTDDGTLDPGRRMAQHAAFVEEPCVTATPGCG